MTTGAQRNEGPPGLADWDAFQVWKLGWLLGDRFEEAVESLGLRGRHFMVMTMLEASDSISQQEIASYMSLDPALIVALLNDLERDGLAERSRNPVDRRRHVVRLTAKGKRLLVRARRAVEAVEADVLARLTEAERRQLGDLAQRVMEPYWLAKKPGS